MTMKKYSPQQTTIKVWSSTLEKLRLLRSLTNISMVAILDGLVTIELADMLDRIFDEETISEGDRGLTQQPDPASFPGQPSQLVGETQDNLEKEK